MRSTQDKILKALWIGNALPKLKEIGVLFENYQTLIHKDKPGISTWTTVKFEAGYLELTYKTVFDLQESAKDYALMGITDLVGRAFDKYQSYIFLFDPDGENSFEDIMEIYKDLKFKNMLNNKSILFICLNPEVKDTHNFQKICVELKNQDLTLFTYAAFGDHIFNKYLLDELSKKTENVVQSSPKKNKFKIGLFEKPNKAVDPTPLNPINKI
jgi:hypothetical protein